MDRVFKETQDNNCTAIKDLFYGLVKTYGWNQGHSYIREDPICQLKLPVNNLSNLHESIDAFMFTDSIEPSESNLENTAGVQAATVERNSGQEFWFSQLPPILILELCWFAFDKKKGVTKIDSGLDFPDAIYLDRYLEDNMEIARSKRKELKSLQERQEMLQSRLKSFQEYGREPKIPLLSALQHALQFTMASHGIVGEADSIWDCAMQQDGQHLRESPTFPKQQPPPRQSSQPCTSVHSQPVFTSIDPTHNLQYGNTYSPQHTGQNAAVGGGGRQ